MREQSFKSSLRSLPKEEGKKERKKDEGLVLDDEWGSCSRAKSANRLAQQMQRWLSNEQLNANPTAKTINSNHHKYQRDCTLFCASRFNRSFHTTCPFYFGREPRESDGWCVSLCACSRSPFSLHHPSDYSPPPSSFILVRGWWGKGGRMNEWGLKERFY
jgi:hypothetical protein